MKLKFTQVKTVEAIAEVARLAAEIWREYYVSIISMEQIEYMIGKYQAVPAITDQIRQQDYEYYLIHSADLHRRLYVGQTRRGQALPEQILH